MSKLFLISIGPGDLNMMIPTARTALQSADVVIGYQYYLDQISELLTDTQTVEVSQLGSEMKRAARSVELATSGKTVAMVSSGDIGIYAMASPVFEVLKEQNWDGVSPEVSVFPGVSAIQATAARLGAPLGHDFCTISLSDLMTPWSVIERRIEAAAWGDFVIGFYNPRSAKRDWQLETAKKILLHHRAPETPVVIARNMTRATEKLIHTTLADLDVTQVDMFSLVLIGNSQSYALADRMVTPRGYVDVDETKEIHEETDAELPLYPISLRDLADRKVIVFGGGPVGERKVIGLLKAKASVTLISPDVTEGLGRLSAEKCITWHQRPYQNGDATAFDLIFAATNDRAGSNHAISQEAKTNGALCNVADHPADGNFHSMAVVRTDGLLVGVNTDQRDPKRAIAVRNSIRRFLSGSERATDA